MGFKEQFVKLSLAISLLLPSLASAQEKKSDSPPPSPPPPSDVLTMDQLRQQMHAKVMSGIDAQLSATTNVINSFSNAVVNHTAELKQHPDHITNYVNFSSSSSNSVAPLTTPAAKTVAPAAVKPAPTR